MAAVRGHHLAARHAVLVHHGQPHGAQPKLADPGRHLIQVVRPVWSGQPVTVDEPRLPYARKISVLTHLP